MQGIMACNNNKTQSCGYDMHEYKSRPNQLSCLSSLVGKSVGSRSSVIQAYIFSIAFCEVKYLWFRKGVGLVPLSCIHVRYPANKATLWPFEIANHVYFYAKDTLLAQVNTKCTQKLIQKRS